MQPVSHFDSIKALDCIMSSAFNKLSIESFNDDKLILMKLIVLVLDSFDWFNSSESLKVTFRKLLLNIFRNKTHVLMIITNEYKIVKRHQTNQQRCGEFHFHHIFCSFHLSKVKT